MGHKIHTQHDHHSIGLGGCVLQQGCCSRLGNYYEGVRVGCQEALFVRITIYPTILLLRQVSRGVI